MKCNVTDLRWQLCDGILGDLEHSELGKQSQVVRQLTDLGPPDVPLSQVGHPLQLAGEVLQKYSLILWLMKVVEGVNSVLTPLTHRPTISVQLEDQFVLIRILLVLLVSLILLLCF